MTESADAGKPRSMGGGLRVAVLVLAVILLISGIGMMAAAPFLFRSGVIDLATAMGGVQQTALWTTLAATGLGLFGLVLSFVGGKHRAGIVAVLVSAAGGMAAGGIQGGAISREDLPPIHDVQTDWNMPVAFTSATLKEREKAGAVRVRDDAMTGAGEGRWSGMLFSEVQGKFFSDIAPLHMLATPADATRAAASAAGRLGWNVTHNDPDGGVVEAIYLSPWYELVHDVAVRVTAEGTGSRIDVRATSRTPGHDMGGNAILVKQMLAEILLAQK